MSLTDCIKRHMKSQPTVPPPLEGAKKEKKILKNTSHQPCRVSHSHPQSDSLFCMN